MTIFRLIMVMTLPTIMMSCSPSKAVVENPARPTEPKVLRESDAKERASSIANAALSKKKADIIAEFGEEVADLLKFTSESWSSVKQEKGKWMLRRNPPSGLMATVSFNLDGSDPKVHELLWSAK